MSLSDNYERVIRIRKRNETENKENLKKKSKQRLEVTIEKKFKTCFIGAIDSVENFLGYLWAKGVDPQDLTKQEKEMRRLWFDLRTEILNKGNNQLRAAKNELEEYDVTWKGKTANFTNPVDWRQEDE